MRWICILQPLQPSKSDQWSGANRQVAIRECRYVGGAVSILQQRADRQLAPDGHFETKADAPFGDVSGGERRNEWVRRGRNDRPRPHSAPGDEPWQPDVGGKTVIAVEGGLVVGVGKSDARLP